MTKPKPTLVSHPSGVTADWLNTVFAYQGDDHQAMQVTSSPIGTGQTADSERFVVQLAQPAGTLSMVGKFPSDDPTSRATGHEHGAYRREVAFYQELAPTVDVCIPALVYADLDPATSEFVLLLADAAPAQQGDQMAGCDQTTAQAVLQQAAALHAPRWGDDSLNTLSFLAGSDDAATLPFEFVEMFWQQFLERYQDRLAPDIIAVGATMVANWAEYSQRYAGPRTLVHGDFRLDNLLIEPAAGQVEPKITVVDWQTAAVGCAASDVSYFLGAGLLVEDRRKWERELLLGYLDQLQQRGVTDYNFETLWFDYRRYSYAGYFMAVLASILVEQTERGDEMFMTMATRHGQQALDLDAAATFT